MASIKLSSGYKVVSEGVHTFTVKEVVYEEDFGKVQLKMETESGEKHTEFYNFNDNDKALFAFTMTAKLLMNNNDIVELDPQQLVGKKMKATVEHGVASNGKTYAKLNDKEVVSESSSESATDLTDDIDLDSLFD